MYRYHTHSYCRKYHKSICSILEMNKHKYKKNQYIIKRRYISNPGGPPEDPWRYIVLLLCPVAMIAIDKIKKSR